MAGIHIHQICYSEQDLQANDSGFLSLNNLSNLRPDWGDYWPIRNCLLNNVLNEDDYYGFFSPKFKAETGLGADTVHEFMRAQAGTADVILFSPFFDLGAFTLNMFEQGAVLGESLNVAIQGSVALVSPLTDLDTLLMDSRNIVFCNYFVAKPAFWKVWLETCEMIFSAAEENNTALGASLNGSTNHGNGVVPNKVYIIERIASLLLSTQRHWKVKAYDSTQLPYSKMSVAKYPDELIQMNALKIASAMQGYPQYLSVFSLLRESILENIQRASA